MNNKLLFAKIERFTSPNTNPGLSVSKLLLKKFRTLTAYFYKSVLEIFSQPSSLKQLKSLKGSQEGKDCIVIANGPSAAKLNISEICHRIKAKDLDVISINNFLDSELAKKISPRFLILSDPFHSPKENPSIFSQINNQVLREPNCQLIVPRGWISKSSEDLVARNIITFQDKGLEGWTNNIKPYRARGYMSLTAFKALAIAKFLGYKTIYIIGLDLSLYKSISVSTNLRLIQGLNYLDGTGPDKSFDYSEMYPGGLADYFYDLSKQHYELKKYFGKLPIINLDRESSIICFSKTNIDNPLITS